MLSLVLAAWPDEIRPEAVDPLHDAAYRMLETVGIRAGMPVFPGSEERKTHIIVSRCLFVDGTDYDGRTIRIHPVEECPPSGFRWKPVLYEHMLLHWSWNITPDLGFPELWALGDHFCRSSPEHRLQHVDIRMVYEFMDYETGRKTRAASRIGRVKCRG